MSHFLLNPTGPAGTTTETVFLESNVQNDILLVAISLLEIRRNHKRPNHMSKESHKPQPYF
jgi:hypothetical protein